MAIQARMTSSVPAAQPIAESRRGSAILIVVGTLALIAVFAAIYISIGHSDQRVASSVENREDLVEIENTIAGHILTVIGDDRLDVVSQHLDDGTGVFAVREVTDAPYTDWTMLSESSDPSRLFRPSGGHWEVGAGGQTDYRVASDSWLAATTPTFLGDPGQPAFGPDFRPFGSAIPKTTSPGDPNPYIGGYYSSGYLDKRDWLQISNLAPDGRFVNLFNLRPNIAFNNSGIFGGFESEPGTGYAVRPEDGRQIRRMSSYLSLWKPRLGTGLDPEPTSQLQVFYPADEGVWLPGRNEPVVIPGLDVENTPAVYTMYQRFMFQPINQPFFTINSQGMVSTWADPDYPYYQYADADGDGMVDSRWFELTAARQADHGGAGPNDPREDVERLYDAGRFRLFAAARVVDLTSMVNVNTATDQLDKPEPTAGMDAPLGITPAEVDLRRLLTMQDGAQNYASSVSTLQQSTGLSPTHFHRSRTSQTFNLSDADYFQYRALVDTDSMEDRRTIRPNTVSLSIGRYAYTAIKRSQYEGRLLDERYYSWPPEVWVQSTDSQTPLMPTDFDDNFNPQDWNFMDASDPEAMDYRLSQGAVENPSGIMGAVGRRDLYNDFGRLDPLVASDTVPGQEVSGLYNEDDLLELLSFHGLNDPYSVSRLEKAAMGRMPSYYNQNQRGLSPLFSNRPLTMDRIRHGYAEENAYNTAGIPTPAQEPVERRIEGSIAKESMAYFAITPRKLLTTVSGSSGLVSGAIINPDDRGLTAGEAAEPLRSVFGSVNSLFSIYRSALAGELEFGKLSIAMDDLYVEDLGTRRTDMSAAPYATLFYGHRGPELALRVAAHSAVNMKDMVDGDQQNSIVTLLVDNNRRDDFDNTNFPSDPDPDNEWYRDYPGVVLGNVLDVGAGNLPGTQASGHLTGGNEHRQAVNIYGIEPMPVITETASFYIFYDAPEAINGDDDAMNIRPTPAPGGSVPPSALPFPGSQENITIENGTNPASDPDCMMHAIAFQLHNPFSTSISLGGTGTDRAPMARHLDPDDPTVIDTDANFQFDYYIEWNGYFFKLAEYQQYYPPSSSTFDLRGLDDFDFGVSSPAIDSPETVPNDPNNGMYLDPATYPDYVARDVVLGPGETRVFYAIADPRFDIANSEMMLDNKWRRAMVAYQELPTNYSGTDVDGDGLFDGLDGRGWTGPAMDWMNRQFVPLGTRPVMVHPMNPKTGEYLDETYKDYLNTPGTEISGANRNDPDEVRLWRKIVTPSEETTDTSITPRTEENLLHNDLLVDRMALESGVAEPIMGGAVINTASFPENYPRTVAEAAAEVRNDNKGFSVVKWAVTSRRDRVTDAMNQETGVGQVREWMLSSRSDPLSGLISAQDVALGIDGNSALSASDFIDQPGSDLDNVLEPRNQIVEGVASPERTDYETQISLFNVLASDPVLVTMGTAPEDKYAITNDGNGALGSEEKFNRHVVADSDWIHPNSVTLHEVDDTDPENLRPDILLNGSALLQAPRIADLLLAWGVGPTYAPRPSGSLSENSDDPGYYPEEWITMTEALAIALGYENPSESAEAADSIWHDAFTAQERLFDNGHLVLDNFVAYYNTDRTQDMDPNVPEFNTNIDVRRGTGVPMALGVLDRARAIDPIQSSFTQEELLSIPTYGQININTAPVEVLRLLPGLSPPIAEYYPDNVTPTRESEWWGIEESDLDLPNLTAPYSPGNSAPLNRTPDVASMLVAYRDRLDIQARFASVGEGLLNDSFPLRYTSDPVSTETHIANLITELDGEELMKTDDARDRATISGVDGLRATPGFGSLGEVMMATIDADAIGAGLIPAAGNTTLRNLYSQMDIQQYGTDSLNLDGDSDSVVGMDPQLFGGDTNGETADDYAERLAMANGILNTITVRSDYYAVWFVIHAYQESDVANLKPEDPLVPSIAKRYVMVVDRTNVKDPGDTPKVVFLREVPM